MSEAITLDTPEQITLWVLLSRRHQIQLHLKGLKTPGLVKWVKANLDTAGVSVRTVRDCIVPVEYAISMAGGDVDYRLVNVQFLERVREDVFQDLGVYDSPEGISLMSYIGQLATTDRLEVILTLEDPRPATGDLFAPA